MSLYLRLVVGPVVVCDLEMFATKPPAAEEPPPQLNGGSGTVVEPYVEDAFGFAAAHPGP